MSSFRTTRTLQRTELNNSCLRALCVSCGCVSVLCLYRTLKIPCGASSPNHPCISISTLSINPPAWYAAYITRWACFHELFLKFHQWRENYPAHTHICSLMMFFWYQFPRGFKMPALSSYRSTWRVHVTFSSFLSLSVTICGMLQDGFTLSSSVSLHPKCCNQYDTEGEQASSMTLASDDVFTWTLIFHS